MYSIVAWGMISDWKLDFYKALDMVSPTPLLLNCQAMSLTGGLLGGVRNWLRSWVQRVAVSGSTPKWEPGPTEVHNGTGRFSVFTADRDSWMECTFGTPVCGTRLSSWLCWGDLMPSRGTWTSLRNAATWLLRRARFNKAKCKAPGLVLGNPQY